MDRMIAFSSLEVIDATTPPLAVAKVNHASGDFDGLAWTAAYQCPLPPSSTRHCTELCADAAFVSPPSRNAATTVMRFICKSSPREFSNEFDPDAGSQFFWNDSEVGREFQGWFRKNEPRQTTAAAQRGAVCHEFRRRSTIIRRTPTLGDETKRHSTRSRVHSTVARGRVAQRAQ